MSDGPEGARPGAYLVTAEQHGRPTLRFTVRDEERARGLLAQFGGPGVTVSMTALPQAPGAGEPDDGRRWDVALSGPGLSVEHRDVTGPHARELENLPFVAGSGVDLATATEAPHDPWAGTESPC